MKLDLVNPVAESIVRAELWRMGVGLEAPIDCLLSTRTPAELVHLVVCPGRPFPFERLAQRRVGLEQVVVD